MNSLRAQSLFLRTVPRHFIPFQIRAKPIIRPRLYKFQAAFSTSNKMASSDPKFNNNDQFQLTTLFSVKDRVALVTGGGSGIGLMAVQALAVNGAKVYIVGRTEEKLDRVAETYGKGISGQIIPLVADITSKKDIQRLVDEISSREKCLCILINNAGIQTHTQQGGNPSPEDFKKNLFDNETAQFDDWAEIYKVNTAQLYFMTTAFLPLLSKSTEHVPGFSASVINITSISGIVLKSQNHFAYNASKGAANHVTRMLASEISNSGVKVRINAIAPGVFPSEMTAGDSDKNQKSAVPKDKYGHLPAQRPGNDRDMANAVLFAATNQYLNGQVVPVDGGYLLKFGS
ncbi:MAG: hypothetical protein Q9216_005887 [Gyalolechia sp. 2 TL-2023]